MSVSIVWFRRDLRLDDNPALSAACRLSAVVPVFIWSPREEGNWPCGAAARWWLHHSLIALDESLRDLGSRLLIMQGRTKDCIDALLRETGAETVLWNRPYEPAAVARDQKIEGWLSGQGVSVKTFNSALLFEPWEIRTKQGGAYRVFTPFWRACLAAGEPPAPRPAPTRLAAPGRWPGSLAVEDLHLLPGIDWADGLRETWTPGERGARAAMKRFLDTAMERYETGRDRPDRAGTSRLSPYLHWGAISPRRVWREVKKRAGSGQREQRHATSFLRQLGWREFSHHVLHHFPQTPAEPFDPRFSGFRWRRDRRGLEAWRRGRTGYPIVDAGMRELWHTGWMHNRVRMIVASFLAKDLLIPWREGAAWFWDTLVDADLANNTMGWQWTAGCGADAAPYFRMFNPVNQGAKFDPNGDYVRKWVLELARLASRWIHRPWAAPESILADAGVRIGEDYPAPIVDHDDARKRALAIYGRLRQR